ncbi:MAG: 2OG-Fe(II) oxygenase [Ilumatobacteraceae bacterium]
MTAGRNRLTRNGDPGDAALAALVDVATVGVVPWSVGRRLWAAEVRDRHASLATYDTGPPYVLLADAIPGDLLDLLGTGQWDTDGGTTFAGFPMGGDYAAVDATIANLVTDMVGQNPWGFPLDAAPVATYLCHRAVGAGSGIARHRDGEMDPCRRWVGLVAYLTSPDAYSGGTLVIDATGERLRPKRGTVILIRGDTQHHVERVTSGERMTLNAFVAEPRPWLLPPADEVVPRLSERR